MDIKKLITDHRFWFILFLITSILCVFVFINNNRAHYDFLSPYVSYIDKKDLLVNFKPLENKLINKYKKNNDVFVSMYFEYLPTGANFSLNKDEKMWPASLIKIPFSMVVMKKIEKGLLDMDQLLIIKDEFKDDDYGSLYLQPSGSKFSVENLLRETLINSDNTAYLTLINKVSNKEVEEVFDHMGLNEEFVHMMKTFEEEGASDISITAKRYSVFFRSLYNSTYLSPYYSNLFLNILNGAECNFLCSSIPGEINVSHKFGVHDEKMISASSGIFYLPGRPYLLTVIIRNNNNLSEKKIQDIFNDISKSVFDYVYYAR